jgi:hypothetical protein
MSTRAPCVDSIFCDAIGFRSAQERAAYLDAVCGADGELRRQVEVLLAAHCRAGNFLGEPPGDPRATDAFSPHATGASEDATSAAAGDSPGQVGPYQLLEPIGEGAWGWSMSLNSSTPSAARWR